MVQQIEILGVEPLDHQVEYACADILETVCLRGTFEERAIEGGIEDLRMVACDLVVNDDIGGIVAWTDDEGDDRTGVSGIEVSIGATESAT